MCMHVLVSYEFSFGNIKYLKKKAVVHVGFEDYRLDRLYTSVLAQEVSCTFSQH
jgi:hypothetical protein